MENDYLMALRERHYGSSPAESCNTNNLNDFVVGQTNKLRSNWPFAHVVEVIKGSNDIVRMVKVKVNNRILVKTNDKLILLKISCGFDYEKT